MVVGDKHVSILEELGLEFGVGCRAAPARLGGEVDGEGRVSCSGLCGDAVDFSSNFGDHEVICSGDFLDAGGAIHAELRKQGADFKRMWREGAALNS